MATSQIILPILGGVRDTSFPPGLGWTGSRPRLLFDDTNDELINFSFRMPSDYASGLTVKWQYSMVSSTTGVVKIRAQVMTASDGDIIDVDSYDTLQASADATVPSGGAGFMDEISFALTNVDSLLANDYFAIQLGRENATTGTNAIGDMEVWSISLTYTTT